MATFKKSVLRNLFFVLLASYGIAAPISREGISVGDRDVLSKRAHAGTRDDPIDASFDISGWPDIAEENCRIMLCELGGMDMFQRQPSEGAADQAYTDAGAALHPFYAANLSDRHTSQINPQTTSAEDFPWRSIQLQPGMRRYLAPATDEQQSRQGAAIRNGYQAAGVGYNQWFLLEFHGAPFGKYCEALFKQPPDTSVCKEKPKETVFGTTNVDLSEEVYFKGGKEGNTIVFEHSNA